MSLDDDLDEGPPSEEVVELRAQMARLQRELLLQTGLKGQLRAERLRVYELEQELELYEKVGIAGPPGWLTQVPKAKADHHAVGCLLLSDLHLDEVVRPEEMRGMNAYNREIAEMRLRKTAEGFVKILRDYWHGHVYDGILLPLGGDLFSGDIHEELKETNADVAIGSFIYWIDPLADVIRIMADEFGKVHVPVVVGNHGRTSYKPRMKFRARSNWDYALGHILARTFANDKRITFDIPDSADCRIPVYNRHILMTHGDQAKGGSGIGGIWPPIMRLVARKRAQGDAAGLPFDLTIMGHWHQYVQGPDFIVNGTMKGYDEYSAISNFAFSEPCQAAWLMSPEHGRTFTAPVFCQDRKAEGW